MTSGKQFANRTSNRTVADRFATKAMGEGAQERITIGNGNRLASLGDRGYLAVIEGEGID
jgi:hypothetical protein